jgi:hypothetical protein
LEVADQLYDEGIFEVKSKFIVPPEHKFKELALVIAGIGYTVTVCEQVLEQLPMGKLVTGSKGVTVSVRV